MNRSLFNTYFFRNEFPHWSCPTCKNGVLFLIEDSFYDEETAQTKKGKYDDVWDSDWNRGRFSLRLKCSNCEEIVFVVGDTEIETVVDEEFNGQEKVYLPRYILPSLNFIDIPEGCPPEVSRELCNAAALYWSSLASAAGRIRTALELLMNDQKVPLIGITKKGKSTVLTLHQRIERYKKKKKRLGEKISAIKWLGNSGAHSANNLTFGDILDAFEIVSYVLDSIYNDRQARVDKITKKVNRKFAPPVDDK